MNGEPAAPRRPDLRLALPALAAWLGAALPLAAAGAAAAPTLAAAAVPAVRRRLRGAGPVLLAAALCLLTGSAVAAAHGAQLRRGPVPGLAARYAAVRVEAEVAQDPVRARGGLLIVPVTLRRVAVPGEGAYRVRTPATVLVSTGQRGKGSCGPRCPAPGAGWAALLPSTRIAVSARLQPPRPGRRDEAAAVLRAHGPPRAVAGPSAVQRLAGRLRAGLRRAAGGLPEPVPGLLPGLVVGDTSRIPDEVRDDFRTTDLSHTLAVSGANLSILLAVVLGTGTPAAAPRGGLARRLGIPLRTSAAAGAALVVGFAVVCRPEPSVLRAAGVALLALVGLGSGRRRPAVPLLSAAVLLLVLFAPGPSVSYGFALSVLATGALLTVAPRWTEGLRRRRVPEPVAAALAAAAAAQAACTPLLVLLDGRVSVVGVVCNLLAEPAVAPATILGFAALAAAPVSPAAAHAAAWLAGWPVRWVAAVARHGAALPGAVLPWPGGAAGVLLAVAALGGAVWLVHGPWRRLPGRVRIGLAALLLAAVAALVVRPPALTRLITGWPPPGWRLVVCNVGQGDGLVLSTGRPGEAVVVDTGPDPKPMDRCLSRLGVRRIPLLLLTHFHADHVGGVPGVLRGRSVGEIEVSPVDEPPGGHARVARWARAARVPVRVAAAGERRTAGQLSWQVLWPAGGAPALPGQAALPSGGESGTAGLGGDGSAANNASVVLLVRTGGITLALLGDLEGPAQQTLLALHPELGRADVLKVAHHGSANQYPPLEARLHPRLSLISVGAGNRYGHPAPRTVALLRSLGSAVERTDRDGAVAVVAGAGGRLGYTAAGGP